MSDEQHTIEGDHYHVWEHDGVSDMFPLINARRCVSAREQMDWDQAQAAKPDASWMSTFAGDPPGMDVLRAALLGLDHDALVEVPPLDLTDIPPVEWPGYTERSDVPRPQWPGKED